MTTLASGSSVTFSLSVDQEFEMSFADGTTGTITVTGPLGSPYRTTFGPAKKNNWKPLPLGTTGRVVIACTAGSVSYTLGTSAFVSTVTNSGAVSLSVGGVAIGGIGQTYTWATKPAASALTGQIFISDVGVGGSYWYSDGSKWRPVGGRVTLKNNITDVTNNAAPKVVLDYATIPAGLWADGDIIEVLANIERTGGTADTHTTDLCLREAPAATVGTSIGLSTSSPSTTNLDMAFRHAMRKESATTIRPISIPGAVGAGTSSVANTVVTVADMDAQTTYLQITSDLVTAGGEVIHLRGFLVTLICGS